MDKIITKKVTKPWDKSNDFLQLKGLSIT